MTKRDILSLIGLIGYALFIWLRDLNWLATLSDTLPILAAFPLYYWLLQPVAFKEKDGEVSLFYLAAAAAFFLIGVATNVTLFFVLSWLLLLLEWGKRRLAAPPLSQQLKLLVILLFGFPWISVDAGTIGWYFRLTGAGATAFLFKLTGYSVFQEGTHLLIDNVPLSVEAACSGLNTLQSMMIAGTALAYIIFDDTQRFWWNVPILVILAWVANTIRIIVIALAAILISPAFAIGFFHLVGGFIVILLMFLLTWYIFMWQKESPR